MTNPLTDSGCLGEGGLGGAGRAGRRNRGRAGLLLKDLPELERLVGG